MGGRIFTEVVDTDADGIGWLIFDHPERRNAITSEMWAVIPQAVQSLDDDPNVRVIVMRGHGEIAFVSGADISEFEETRIGNASRHYNTLTHAAFDALKGTRKCLVAMIHGFCIGGGAAISLCADLRYAADDATFGVPPAKLGLGYHSDGVLSLMQTVGPAHAAELLFTAKRFDAPEAERIGFVHRIYPKTSLETEVRQLAASIATNAPLTIESAKINLRELAKPANERDQDKMQASINACFDSEDYKEGVNAFLEKRPAHFKGV